jgi:hypothetical protein
METNLPATRDDTRANADERPPFAPHRPVTVAMLPLALVMFIIAALTIAAWTFLAATT